MGTSMAPVGTLDRFSPPPGTPTVTSVTAHFVVSDVHGYVDDLVAAAQGAGLVDDAGDWIGHDELWVLGDYFDRGPDGVAVVETLMRWQQQAQTGGGRVEALLGNHEALALGMRWFGQAEVPGPHGSGRSFVASWILNGGRMTDQVRLTDRHEEWLVDRPMLARLGSWLLMHSDTTDYLEWGNTVDEVNAASRRFLHERRIDDVWECWRRLTSRGDFRGRKGTKEVARMLSTLGGTRIVHGHSTIPYMLGIDAASLDPLPVAYAEGRVLAIDGGRYEGGPLIVAPLDAIEKQLDAQS
jgi:hypothetical protein